MKRTLTVVLVVTLLLPLGAAAGAEGATDYTRTETWSTWNPCTGQNVDFTYTEEGKRLITFNSQNFHLMQRALWTVSTADGFESQGGVTGTNYLSVSPPFVGVANFSAVLANPDTGQRFRISGSQQFVVDANGEIRVDNYNGFEATCLTD